MIKQIEGLIRKFQIVFLSHLKINNKMYYTYIPTCKQKLIQFESVQ